MEYRVLGNTGIKVSRLCFGSLTMGPLQAALRPGQGGALLDKAYEYGVNFVDTAQYYRNYCHINASRSNYVVASKTYAYNAADALAAVEEARQQTGRDVIDIFLLHEQESTLTLRGHREALEELYRLKAAGYIRAVGLSTHHVSGVDAAVEWKLDIVHPIINIGGIGIADGSLMDMESAVRRAHEAGLGVYAMKALGGGHLFRRAAEALNYVLSLDYVDSIAVGMKSAEEIEANAAFFVSGSFSPEDLQRLRVLERRLLIEDWCTGCGECLKSCSAGALSLNCGRAVCDSALCRLCGYCVCPGFAIKII